MAIRPRLDWCRVGTDDFKINCRAVSDCIEAAGVRLIVDAETPFLINPDSLEPPPLVGDAPRLPFWLDQIHGLLSGFDNLTGVVVTIPSGPGGRSAGELDLLAERIGPLVQTAAEHGQTLAIRPAIGHVIDSLPRFERLRKWVDGPIGLAADVGEMLGSHELPIVARLEHHREALALVYVSCPGDGESLPAGRPAVGAGRTDRLPGHGELDFDRLLGTILASLPDVPAVVRMEHHAALGLEPARRIVENR